MSNNTSSLDEIKVEIYRRAIRLYVGQILPWVECLDSAIASIQLELDYWVMTPAR